MSRKIVVLLSLAAVLVAVPALGAVVKYEATQDQNVNRGITGAYNPATDFLRLRTYAGDLQGDFTTPWGGTTAATGGTFTAAFEVTNDGTGWKLEGLLTIKDQGGSFIVGWFESNVIDFVGNRMAIVGTLVPDVGSTSIFRSDTLKHTGATTSDPGWIVADDFAIVEFSLCTNRTHPDIFFTDVEPEYVNPICGGWVTVTFQTVPFPEPATMSLLALGGLALLRRRSSR